MMLLKTELAGYTMFIYYLCCNMIIMAKKSLSA